jgi:peroxiredoxin
MKTITLGLLALALFGVEGAFAFQGTDLLTRRSIEFPKSGTRASVLVFLSARCPCSNGHEQALKKLYSEFSKSGFEFVGIHSNQNETPDETLKHFRQSSLPFPVVEDPDAKIANELKALKTPHVFVMKEGESLFEGGVDDTASGTDSKKQFLRDALTEINSGKPVTEKRVRVLGCAIKRSKS